MQRLKKVYFSLGILFVIFTNLYSASYIPLTSDNYDNRWILIGVNGFKVDGGSAAISATFNPNGTTLTDAGGDDNATSGLNNLVSLKSLINDSITINIDISNKTFSSTEPVRSMFIKSVANNDNSVIIKLDYKATLEGETVEFYIGNDSTKIYTTTIDSKYTYSNPAYAILKSETPATGGIELSNISDIVDYDLTDNPPNPDDYVKADNQTPGVAGANLRLYEYNALSQSWLIYDSKNTLAGNDFDTLKKGKGYWAKLDANGDGTSSSNVKAGLVLGSSGLTPDDYNGELAQGWNLISFDDANSKIKYSSTGLIVDISNAQKDDNITFKTSLGNNEVEVTLTSDHSEIICKDINKAIKQAKIDGTLSNVFELKAFPIDTTDNKILIISNQKFTIIDSDIANTQDLDALGSATTFAGQTISSNINNTSGIESIYGEFGLLIQPIIGSDSAAHIDSVVGNGDASRSAKLQINTNTAIGLDVASNNDGDPTLSTVVAALKEDDDIDNAIIVDINLDGVLDQDDYVLVANKSKSFYIRDHTFTRVYIYDNTRADGSAFKILGDSNKEISINASNGDDAYAIANKINSQEATSKVFAKALSTTQLALISTDITQREFEIVDNQQDLFRIDTSSSDITKGAIKGVISLDYLAKQDITSTGELVSTAPNLISDLRYNAIFTPNYAEDGPLYTLREKGFVAKSIIGAETKLSDGSISWDSTDLTQEATYWTSNKNYNLFDTDGRLGYWVYLEPDPNQNSISLDKISIKPRFKYNFNSDGTTENIVMANFETAIGGLPTDKSTVNVVALLGDSEIYLASSDDNQYSGVISSYEISGFKSGATYEVKLKISDGLGYKKTILGGIFDYQKPASPTITLGNGLSANISSTSADVTAYYIYKDYIPEEDTSSSLNKIAKILSADAATYNLCANSNISYGTTYTMKLFATDSLAASSDALSDGELGYGNISDVVTFNYTATLKGSADKNVMLLVNTNGTDATQTGNVYDSSCIAQVDSVSNRGVSIKSISNGKTVAMSFPIIEGVQFDTNLPIIDYVTDSTGSSIVKIQYASNYVGEKVFIELNGKVYSHILRDDSSTTTSDNPLQLTANIANGNQTLIN